MAPSFLPFGALAAADKRCIAQALLAIARAGGDPPGIDGLSMLDWLQRMNQTPAAIERFWRVVLVSALDEELARTDARYGIDVFWKAFLASRKGYRVGIPSVPLAELYDGCLRLGAKRGGEVRLRCGVREIRSRGRPFRKGHARRRVGDYGGCVRRCRAAWPSAGFAACRSGAGPGLSRGFAPFEDFADHERALSGSKGPVMKEPFLALLDHTTQWIFNKTLLNSVNVTAKAPARLTGERPPGDCPGFVQRPVFAACDQRFV